MCTNETFQMKYECDDSNFPYRSSSSYHQDEEHCDQSQMGELTPIKTAEGNQTSVYLRTGNRLLFCSGKYFYIEHTTAQTDHQKEHTGIVGSCHTCGVKIKGSLKVSSNFICHLKNKHPEIYQEFLRQKSDYTAAYVRIPKKNSGASHRASPYQATTPILSNLLQNNEKQEQFQHSLIQFLVDTNQSFEVVESPSFLKLFEFIDFPVQVRNADYYEKIVKDACEYKRMELYNIFNNGRVYVCNTIDAWSYKGNNYIGIASHWIDEHYQRQSALLACRKATSVDELETVRKDVLSRYGFVPATITASPTLNITNFTEDLLQFGLIKDVLIETDCHVLKEMSDNLKCLLLNNEELMELDIMKLNKIWGRTFVDKLSESLKFMHKSVMEKCCSIWVICHTKEFGIIFQSVLNEPMARPHIFSLTSIYTAIKQLIANKDRLDHICCYLNKPCFTAQEIEYLEELLDVFEPLNVAFAFLDLPQNNYYGCFLPTLVTLKWKLTRLYNSNKLIHLQETLTLLKNELLQEFKDYYDLSESKSEAIVAALTYPPVKTRFLTGVKDNVSCLNFQPRNVLLKYGKEHHQMVDQKDSFALNHQMPVANPSSAVSDFFDFGDNTETVDAEELRDVNISKKEIAELMSELLSNLNEGIALESIELDTPRKFLLSFQDDRLNTPNTSPQRLDVNPEVSRQLEFEEQTHQESLSQSCAITSSNVTQQNLSFHPDVMSTPSSHNLHLNAEQLENENMTMIPVALPNQNIQYSPNSTVAIPTNNLNTQVDLIALPIPGQPNCFQLAKVVNSAENSIVTAPTNTSPLAPAVQDKEQSSAVAARYSVPYETNYTVEYISVRRHAIAEYIEKFENLKNEQVNHISSTTSELELSSSKSQGFSKYQYDLLQQQMRIHVQMLTQTYVQTYCHPELWKMAKKPKEMLLELKTKSINNANFKIWNLDKAIDLINKWQQELDANTEENRELMKFLHKEVQMTNHNSRQIPRFHPRILDCYLESDVFMYPQYLPRMPFSPKILNYEVFSPVESYLIAMGLEKHVKIIMERKERIPSKSTPLRMACKRLTKDTLSGKHSRRVWDHIMHLRKVSYYNPIKYYFEHNKAPPVEHTPIIGFENNTVLPPKDRFEELPLVFQNYLEKKNNPPKAVLRNKKIVTHPRVKASDTFRNSYLEFVREAVGEDITLPDNFTEASEPDASAASDSSEYSLAKKRRKSSKEEPRAKRRLPNSLTINVNYVFGASPHNASIPVSTPLPALPPNTLGPEANLNSSTLTNVSIETRNLQDSTINQSVNSTISVLDNTENCTNTSIADTPAITYDFDLTTQTLRPSFPAVSNLTQHTPDSNPVQELHVKNNKADDNNQPKFKGKRRRKTVVFSHLKKLNKNTSKKALAYRDKRLIRQRCEDLITAYGLHLESLQSRYKHSPLVQSFYRKFKALELYTDLLMSLKMICNKNTSTASTATHSGNNIGTATSAGGSPSGLKRTRNTHAGDDDNSPSSQRMARKINRQEENFRHMLLPDTPEEANRKDAIYAFNFYEKVEEAFKASNRPDDCKKFNTILKSFDPKKDKVSDLYYKLEKLFLPDHPELAQVFLTFLLPSEAAEIGKFFEHFMINNMTTFVNKLNIYFNKQPAQIRKIYNCLNELANDPNVTMKQIESKIVPLLKGNQFLIDWFMQQFPKSTPPERLFSTPEHIPNVKEQQSNRTSEHVETLTDLLGSPNIDTNTQQSCQLRYINGRIFYGSKMLLPAKLSFMATSYKDNRPASQVSLPAVPSTGCVHAIKEHGERRLQSASELANVAAASSESTDDQDRSEEDDVSKALVIDTTADEDDSCSSFEPCDENTLKAHALRLNPAYYGSTCYSSNATSTPNLNTSFQSHHPNAKKVSLNFYEDSTGSAAAASGAGKTSPRKNSSQNQHATNSPSSTCQLSFNAREKRKSPSKKTKSPLNNTTPRAVRSFNQPMVVIHENNSAIQCAKRLKSLVEGTSEEHTEETWDTKEIMHIVARTKNSMKSASVSTNNTTVSIPKAVTNTTLSSNKNSDDVKQEDSDDLEFLSETRSITHSPFPTLKMDTDSNEEDGRITKDPPRIESDEDCKIDIVATLATEPETSTKAPTTPLPLIPAWTRDEDKIILIEMKMGSQNREELYQRIAKKLPQRTLHEITARHQFLMDFLSKLQGK